MVHLTFYHRVTGFDFRPDQKIGEWRPILCRSGVNCCEATILHQIWGGQLLVFGLGLHSFIAKLESFGIAIYMYRVSQRKRPLFGSKSDLDSV